MEGNGRGDPHLSTEDKVVLEAGRAIIAFARLVWGIVTTPPATEDPEVRSE